MLSGIKIPIKAAKKIPAVHINYAAAPKGPLNSIGAISFINLGTKTV